MNQNDNQDMHPLDNTNPLDVTPNDNIDVNNTQEGVNPSSCVDTPPEDEPMVEEVSGEDVPVAETLAEETPATETPVTQPPVVEEPPVAEENPQPVTPPCTYRWTYADQRQHDSEKQKKGRSAGLLMYAVVMTAVFALSFGLLLGVMFMKGEQLSSINISEGITDEGDIADRESIAPVEAAKHSVVVIEVTGATSQGSGTGIVLTQDGYIATNHHVIDGGGSIRVRFYDGTYAEAEVRGSSEVDDLAVLKVERSGLLPATFAKSSNCYVGETVYAIGNPGGPDFAWTTTKGIVSYVDREVKIYDDEGILEKKLKLLQTDAKVNPGNSGGPLVNSKGEVVGVVSMKLADGYEGIGFAIPSDGAVEILNAIIRDGNADSINSNISYDRPVIGIVGVYVEGGKHYIFDEERIQEVDETYASFHDDVISPEVSGIYVSGLTEGMDAYEKLKVGDIITAVDGVKATSMYTLMNEINEHYAGDEVEVTYYRNGRNTTVTITLSAAAS